MNWQFNELVAFMRIMETNSLTAAAAEMKLSKSVLSRCIQKLETTLKLELFHRSRRTLRPTDVALDLYRQMQPLILEIQRTVETVSFATVSLVGHLRITGPVTFGTMFLNPVVSEFCRLHPLLNVTLDLDDRLVDLTQSPYDVGVRIGLSRDSSLRARALGVCQRVVCCSPAYAEKHGMPSSIAELSVHEGIDYTYVHSSQLWQFENQSDAWGPAIRVGGPMPSRFVSNNGQAVRDAALAGLGLAILPTFFVASEIREGKLRVVLPKERPVPGMVYALYPPTRHVAPKVRVFIDYLVGTLPERLITAQQLDYMPA